ncbi:roadblock/LC7 domain-containing protein [Candidatus Methanoperedens nitratireducens]|uniref:Roadblock/LC7 family protein n=1 Tax=Candidatus Methanoperedens nitratireducens TaxID=1392998 RepID=A0A284VJU1_9EURY|nr:roadblock/LC7 domain-containing protein [Candidatus Methanoperedens nitroreducens]SNQ59518.1 Roadblock/LC7 family protein [Candidatus Methanoperedens nitroreducens]
METIAQSLEKILDDLQAVGGVELSAIVSRQGLLMVSKDTGGGLNSEAFAALTATLYISAESTTVRLSGQRPRSIIVETEDKHLITYAAGPDALMVVLVGQEGYIGLVLNELKKAASKVRQFI